MVDDEIESLHTISLILTMAGYQVTTYANPQKALQEIIKKQNGQNPFELLITDIEMPYLKGDQLIDEVQKSGIIIPTIVMTGHGKKELVIKLMRKGCVDFIDKPISPDFFLQRVSDTIKTNIEKKKNYERSNKFTELGDYAIDLIHDINNMLCTSCGFADLALSQLHSTDRAKIYLSKVCKSTTFASKLINQLFLISIKKEFDFKSLNLGKEVKKWIDMAKIVVGKTISIQYNTVPDIPPVIADHVSIGRLLINLISTFRDSMTKGGSILITVRKSSNDSDSWLLEHTERSENYVCLSLDTTEGSFTNDKGTQTFQSFINSSNNPRKHCKN